MAENISASREKLDQFALDIEFLLISVVQGVALGVLASIASGLIEQFRVNYFFYIACAFLVILVFWSQAIIHAISFIDWPLDLFHNFLYFLASFIEVIAFSQIIYPLGWFAFMTVFFLVAEVLYYYDLRLIKQHERKYENSDLRRKLFKHIIERQKFEMRYLVPMGIIFNLTAVFLIINFRNFFIVENWNLALISIEVLFILLILISSIKSFRKRSSLISESAGLVR